MLLGVCAPRPHPWRIRADAPAHVYPRLALTVALAVALAAALALALALARALARARALAWLCPQP